MTGNPKKLAVCTTIYPAVEPYLRAWYASVLQQMDREFQLWIALDGLDVARVSQAMGSEPAAVWVQAESGETPAQIRQRVLASLLDQCDGVVLVDSDDILHPGRVAAARTGLQQADLIGCALRLVDQKGQDLGATFDLPLQLTADSVLPRNNVFGLSNTAWRSDLLRRCLPIPAAVELVDWFLATRAWLMGATLNFDGTVQMDYRQHPSNMTRVRPPFQREQVVRDTERVLRHFQLVGSVPLEGARPDRLRQLALVVDDVERFADRVLNDPQRLTRYLDELNAQNPPPLWWSCVAYPLLQHLWL